MVVWLIVAAVSPVIRLLIEKLGVKPDGASVLPSYTLVIPVLASITVKGRGVTVWAPAVSKGLSSKRSASLPVRSRPDRYETLYDPAEDPSLIVKLPEPVVPVRLA